jgi:hypothetical protein
MPKRGAAFRISSHENDGNARRRQCPKSGIGGEKVIAAFVSIE